jgi:hypothetical protein
MAAIIKPNVRFDEGELEIEHAATTPALYSTERCIKKAEPFLTLPFICKDEFRRLIKKI